MGLLGRVSEGAMQQLCRRKMGKNLRICLRVHRTLGFLDQDHWELAQQAPAALLQLADELDRCQQSNPDLFGTLVDPHTKALTSSSNNNNNNNTIPPSPLQDTQ